MRKKFAELINMDEELINDDPHSLISQASLKFKEDPSLAKKIQKTIEEYRFGPRELSQSELDSLEQAGKDIGDHKKAMQRRTQKNNDFIDRVLMSVLQDFSGIEKRESAASKAKKKKQDKKDTEGSMRALAAPSKPKPAPPKEAESKEEEERGYGSFFKNALG